MFNEWIQERHQILCLHVINLRMYLFMVPLKHDHILLPVNAEYRVAPNDSPDEKFVYFFFLP